MTEGHTSFLMHVSIGFKAFYLNLEKKRGEKDVSLKLENILVASCICQKQLCQPCYACRFHHKLGTSATWDMKDDFSWSPQEHNIR